MDKWKKKRDAAFNQAVAEIGPLTKDTHSAIKKRIKELEKEPETMTDVLADKER